MAEQYKVVGQLADSEGTLHDVLEAQVGTKGAGSWEKWYTCGVCGLEFPRSGVVVVGGVAYCQKYGHADPEERR